MASQQPCQVVLLTPLGRGAVASLSVEGEQAVMIVSRFFRSAAGRPLEDFPWGRIVFGRWQSEPSHATEELVVCQRTQHHVEIHCHGGQAATELILQSLVDAGCRAIDWREWLVQSSDDPISVQARLALAEASTQRCTAILLDQLRGALRSAIEEVLQLLQQDNLDDATERLQQIARYNRLGQHLCEPWQVVLAGRPNVGKSSLINRLVGYPRAIVYHRPGTTRDIVTATTALDGWPVELADTAGLQESGDKIERAGIALALDRLAGADLAVLVFDIREPWTARKKELVQRVPEALLVFNKSDLISQPSSDLPEGLQTSTVTDQGIERLLSAIIKKLVPENPPSGAPVPFTSQQIQAIVQALAVLRQSQKPAAEEVLRQLILKKM